MKAPLEDTVLAPGESTLLEVIFSTKKYSSVIAKRVRIETNEGLPPRYVTVRMNVVARPDSTYPFVIRPYKLDISQIGPSLRDRVRFAIDNVSDSDVRLSVVDSPKDIFNLALPHMVRAGRSITGRLKLRHDAIPTSFEKSFTLELADADHTRFTVPVKRFTRQ